MSPQSVKIVLAAALAGAAIAGAPERMPEVSLALVLFGLFNLLVEPQGTRLVRLLTLAYVVPTLVVPQELTGLAMMLTWLVWPPAYLATWGLARAASTPVDEEPEGGPRGRRARVATAAIVVAVAAAALAFRAIRAGGLHQTAMLFVGIPTLLAVIVVLAVSARSAVGVACKAVTVGLLVSLLFLGEGMLCVVMSAPLFYAIAIFIAMAMGRGFGQRRRGEADPVRTIFSSLALLAILPMCLEGVTAHTSLARDEQVVATRVVPAPAEAVGRALVEPPRFERALPSLLRIGFPRPTAARIDTATGPRRWVVRMRGGEMRIDGMEPRAGDLVLDLVDARPGSVTWRAISDDSHMTHFLDWRESTVQWEAVDAQRTRVTWTLRYRRGLDPAWYFGPMERYAAQLAAGYLIDTVATP